MAIQKKAKKRKTKSASTSISDFWNRINTLVPEFLKKSDNKEEILKGLVKIQNDMNSTSMPTFISDNLATPFLSNGGAKISVSFSGEDSNTFHKWAVSFDKPSRMLRINPVGLYIFRDFFRGIDERIEKTDIEEAFTEYRLLAFGKEVAKLPEQYLLFIAVLKGIAEITGVCVSDAKNARNSIDPHTVHYLTILWALKQFEDFYAKVQNRNIRSDYHIIWHEGEWLDA